ncbi:MAG: hypothetical protein ACJ75H_13810 [Thermoanaerobaculia bacterium]
MTKHRAILLTLAVLALAGTSCRSRTDRDGATVIISVHEFSGVPFSVSLTNHIDAQGNDLFTIENVGIANNAKDSNGVVTPLQDVQMRSYEVRYRRRDPGRVPPPTVLGISGTVEGGQVTNYLGVPWITSDQILNQPLKDLLDFGRDRETNSTVITLDVSMRFFGRTLSGDEVSTDPATFTVEIRQ